MSPVKLCFRIMRLSKKLTAMNEVMSCDPSYLGKVHIQFFLCCIRHSYVSAAAKLDSLVSSPNCIYLVVLPIQVGKERQRFDYDDFDTVPSKFIV